VESKAPEQGDPTPGGKRRSRWLIVLAVGASLVAALLIIAATVIYAERRLIAANFVKQYLAQYGIDSEVEFDRLAWGGFIARVRAGSVEAPDFTAEGVDVTLIYPDSSSYVSSVTPQVAAVRLVRPLLHIDYDGKKFSFGSLQPLIDEILSQPSGAPGPEIAIDNGRILLTTPYGTIGVLADAVVDKGMLARLQGTIASTTLRGENFVADLKSGTLSATMDGGAMNAKASLSLTSLQHAGRVVRGVDMNVEGQGIEWQENKGDYTFSIDDGVLAIGTGAAETPEFTAARTSARIGLQAIEGSSAGDQLRFTGRGVVSGEAAELRAAGAQVALLKTDTSLFSFSADVSSGTWSADATAHVALDGTGTRYSFAGGEVTLASVRTDFDSTAKLGMEGASGTFKGTATANGSLPQQMVLRSIRADFDGELAPDGNHRLLLTSLTASGGTTRDRALALARDIPGVGSDEPLTSAVATAFQNSSVSARNVSVATTADGVTLTGRAPIAIEGAQKASLRIAPRGATPLVRTAGDQMTGGFDLDVAGGGLPQLRLAVASYRYRMEQNRTVLDADAAFKTALSYGAFRGVDLSGSGKLAMAGDRARFEVPQCADLTFASYAAAGADLVRNLKGRFCGATIEMNGARLQLNLAQCADVTFAAFITGGADQLRDARGRLCATPNRPLLVSQPSGWQLEAGLTDAAARLVAGDVAVSSGVARVQLAGDPAAILSGAITLERANLADLQTTARFQPISVSGAIRAAGDDWTGDIALSFRDRRLATIALKHALNTGAGEAAITARGVAFEPNMLQPADIAPFLSAFGQRIRGTVDFTGRFSWSKDGITSDGRLVVPGVDLQSPLGAVRQLKTELAFTSLMPVALRPAQTVTVDRLDLALPLEQVSATFSYAPEAVRLDTATASVAQGRATLDAMTYNLAPGSTSSGTLRLQNINAQTLVEVAGLADRMGIEARIDGAIPFTLGPEGVRFVDGRVAANAPGRLSIKREALTASVGTGGTAQAPPNAVQDFAYQALEHLAFERLEGVVNSKPMGRLGLLLRIVGQNDPPKVEETRVGVLALLRGQAFDKPLPLPKGTPIDLTLDTSLNLDELLDSYLNRSGAGAAAPVTAAQ
jgi:hypothetical protein